MGTNVALVHVCALREVNNEALRCRLLSGFRESPCRTSWGEVSTSPPR
jgi:hypothetical protein